MYVNKLKQIRLSIGPLKYNDQKNQYLKKIKTVIGSFHVRSPNA